MIRVGAFECGNLKKHGPHLLLQIPQLHKVSFSFDFCSGIHLQSEVGSRPIKGSWVSSQSRRNEMGSRNQSHEIARRWL